MVIIEVLSWIIRFLSMGLRIAGNIVAGHVILGILGFAYVEFYKIVKLHIGLSDVMVSVVMQISYVILTYFELAVAIIQAYVLTLLASTFLKETEEIH
jgi:F-type H+-transporting ATPase subunit a